MSVIKEICYRSSNFIQCDFMFESRLANFDSHNLARFSLSLERERHVWHLNPHNPDVISLYVKGDQ